MKILLVDDEAIAIRNLKGKLREIDATNEIVGFTEPSDALQYARDERIEVAFLDIEMRGMSGLVLAKKLKELHPNIGIVFVTAHSQYAVEAFAVRATGYLLKPVELDSTRRELEYAFQTGTRQTGWHKLRVQTFGGFDVFVDEKPLVFKRTKAKELLAYLVDKRGNSVTTREACSILWNGVPYDIRHKNYFQHLMVELRKTLEQAEVSHVLVKSHNSLAINPAMLDCDSYNFMKGDPAAIRAYRNNYMTCYDWAEFSMGGSQTEEQQQ